MKYLVGNIEELTRLEEYVKLLPEEFTKEFDIIKSHPCSSDIIYMTVDEYFNSEITLITLENTNINFIYSEEGKLTEVLINGEYKNKMLYLKYKGMKSSIKNIKFKQF